VLVASGQLEIERQRCLEVGERLGDQRDAVVAGCGEALEFQFGDHSEVLARSARPCLSAATVLKVGRRGPGRRRAGGAGV
jgi:hypothetical protein